jgi:hypothetical protein
MFPNKCAVPFSGQHGGSIFTGQPRVANSGLAQGSTGGGRAISTSYGKRGRLYAPTGLDLFFHDSAGRYRGQLALATLTLGPAGKSEKFVRYLAVGFKKRRSSEAKDKTGLQTRCGLFEVDPSSGESIYRARVSVRRMGVGVNHA